MLNNLIEIIVGDFSETINVWKDIPYPNGFNSENSTVIIQSLGNDSPTTVTFKIHVDLKRYSVIGVGTNTHIPLFIFIKK